MTRNNRGKQHWSRNYDRNVLKLQGGMDESDMKDTSETEEERETQRKLEETIKSKSTENQRSDRSTSEGGAGTNSKKLTVTFQHAGDIKDSNNDDNTRKHEDL